MYASKDSRTYKRLSLAVGITGLNGAPQAGRTRNISLGGIFVEGWTDPIGKERAILIGNSDQGISIRAVVVRISAEGVGMRFLKPSATFLLAALELAPSGG
jgi:hypothetical protein